MKKMMRKGRNERALLIEVTKRRSQRLNNDNGHIFIIINRYLLVNNNYNGHILYYY